MSFYNISLWALAIVAWALQLSARILRRFGVLSPAPRPGDQCVSAPWLTEIFKQKIMLNQNQRVKEIIVKDLAANRGLTGRLLQLELAYDNVGPGAPLSLKFIFLYQ